MKRHALTLFALALLPACGHAEPRLELSKDACEKFNNDTGNNIFRDMDNLFKCTDFSDEEKPEMQKIMEKELHRRYPSLSIERIHELAKVNEFKAKEIMGQSYFMLHARFHRVSSNNDGSLLFEVYNGGGNKYIYDSVSVPVQKYKPKLGELWIWNQTLKKLAAMLPKMTEGDHVTFICHRDEWRVRSPYAEDFNSCVYFDSSRDKS